MEQAVGGEPLFGTPHARPPRRQAIPYRLVTLVLEDVHQLVGPRFAFRGIVAEHRPTRSMHVFAQVKKVQPDRVQIGEIFLHLIAYPFCAVHVGDTFVGRVQLQATGLAPHQLARHAMIAKTSSTYVEAVKAIGRQAPELLDKVRSGIIKVPDATKLARLPKDERWALLARCNGHPLDAGELHGLLDEIRKEQRAKAARAFARRAKDNGNIIIGDMGVLWKRLRDKSVDLFMSASRLAWCHWGLGTTKYTVCPS